VQFTSNEGQLLFERGKKFPLFDKLLYVKTS